MKLYQITESMRTLLESCDPETGVLTEEQLAEFEKLEGNLDDKLDAICAMISEWNAEEEVARAEGKRLYELASARKSRSERLKAYAIKWLMAANIRRHSTGRFEVVIQNNSNPSADCIVEPEMLDKEFRRVTIEPNKQKAVEYFKLHDKPPEGFKIWRGVHMRIK